MRKFLSLITTLACTIVLSNCDCPPIVRLYKEIGCTATEEGATTDCPISFDCKKPSDYEEDKCYYGNKSFVDEEMLPDKETFSTCTVGCVCDNFVSPALFTCSAIDCDIDFTPPKPNCIRLYAKDSCCANEELCDEEKIEALGTCSLDGKTYRLGERMYPRSHPCHKCVCTDSFDSDAITENCVELGCGLQLRSISKFREGCIPIYYKDPLPDVKSECCPLDWRCPDDQENFVDVVGAEEGSDSKNQCSFGNLTMTIGSVLASQNDNIECKCTTPPMPQCLMKQLTFDVSSAPSTMVAIDDTLPATTAETSMTSKSELEPIPESVTEGEPAATTVIMSQEE